MINHIDTFEKENSSNFNNASDDDFDIENIDFNNKINKQLDLVLSPKLENNQNLSKLLKPFTALLSDDCSELHLIKSSSNLKIIDSKKENESNSSDSIKDNNENKSDYIQLIYKKDKIFSIKKIRKRGRIKKNSFKKGKHDKNNRDNIIRKFKVKLMNSLYDYINRSFIINTNRQTRKIKIIKKLSSNDTTSIKKEDNIKWFNSQIKNVFSQNISTKIAHYDLDYNSKLINKIYLKGQEKRVINILDKTIKEMWLVYVNDDEEYNFKGFHTLKDEIKEFRKKGQEEAYIEKYIKIAKNFEEIFVNIKSRNNKKKSKIINNK